MQRYCVRVDSRELGVLNVFVDIGSFGNYFSKSVRSHRFNKGDKWMIQNS